MYFCFNLATAQNLNSYKSKFECKNACGNQFSLKIYSGTGQIVKELEFDLGFDNFFSFAINDLNPGIYVISILDVEKRVRNASKFIVE